MFAFIFQYYFQQKLFYFYFKLCKDFGMREDWTGDSKISDADKSGLFEYF